MKRIYKKNNDALLPTKLINVITENDYLREFQDFQLVAVYSFLEKEMKKKTEKVHTESDISPHSIDRFIYACTKSMFHEGNGMRMKKKRNIKITVKRNTRKKEKKKLELNTCIDSLQSHKHLSHFIRCFFVFCFDFSRSKLRAQLVAF